jgi:hypothetical protein
VSNVLKSFEIEGFRTFEHLHIGRLARVNLVVGRNNVGKTMLLEALRVYVDGAHFASIARILLARNEVAALTAPSRRGSEAELRIEALFHGRPAQLRTENKIALRDPTHVSAALHIDADLDLDRRWRQVQKALVAAGYRDAPEQPKPGGTIVHGPDLPPAGIWLMPDKRLPGILEDFLAFLIPAGDPLLPRVDAFLDAIPGLERRFAAKDRPKARLHAWLAAQEQPGKPLGQAIQARYLDAEAAAVAPFLSWLRAALVD